MKAFGFVTKGGLGVLPQKKILRILENGAILCTKWIEIACSTGIYIGIDKCFGPPISPGPGEIPPPPPPLSVGLHPSQQYPGYCWFISFYSKALSQCQYLLFSGSAADALLLQYRTLRSTGTITITIRSTTNIIVANTSMIILGADPISIIYYNYCYTHNIYQYSFCQASNSNIQ